MSHYAILFSPTGGTARVAGILTAALGGQWQQLDLCAPVPGMDLFPDDVCLVAVPCYGGRVPALALERLKALRGHGARAILVCVYGNRAWEDTLTELQDALEDGGFVCAAAVAAVAEHSIFRQFGAGRPDAGDTSELILFAAQIRSRLLQKALPSLRLEGNHGSYKHSGGVPFKPEGNKRCTGCGLCAKGCPAGAIDPANPRKTNQDMCISCMRCVSLCPAHARNLSPLLMKPAALAMAPMLGRRKGNHLFL